MPEYSRSSLEIKSRQIFSCFTVVVEQTSYIDSISQLDAQDISGRRVNVDPGRRDVILCT